MSFLLSAFCAAAVLALGALAQNQSDSNSPSHVVSQRQAKLLEQLRSPDVQKRIDALHALVGHDRSLPILGDSNVRSAFIHLLDREDRNERDTDAAEDVLYQEYDDFVAEAVQKIATEYHDPRAWKALVESGPAGASPLGSWLAGQPETYAIVLQKVDDKDYVERMSAFDMLGEICVINPGKRPEIHRLLLKKAESSNDWTLQGSISALGTCGTHKDIAFLDTLPACSKRWNIEL